MAGIIGKKIGMTSVFSADGKNSPCTIIEAGPCVVTQIKTQQIDGYESVQLGFDDKKEKNTSKAEKGHYAKAGTTPKKYQVEFRDFRAEFDDKVNPFYKMWNEDKLKLPFHYGSFLSFYPHNLIRQVGAVDNEVDYISIYTYDDDGYPISTNNTNQNGGGGNGNGSFFFEYN